MNKIVNKGELFSQFPNFPTHRHKNEFWEELGRTVGTFGFLEEILIKAIYAISDSRPYSKQAFFEWVPSIEKLLTNSLGKLIEKFHSEVKNHPNANIKNLETFIEYLKEAAKIRNALCHGSWSTPDEDNASIPFYVNNQFEVLDTPVNCDYLIQVRRHVAELSCEVINTVLSLDLKFPGFDNDAETL